MQYIWAAVYGSFFTAKQNVQVPKFRINGHPSLFLIVKAAQLWVTKTVLQTDRNFGHGSWRQIVRVIVCFFYMYLTSAILSRLCSHFDQWLGWYCRYYIFSRRLNSIRLAILMKGHCASQDRILKPTSTWGFFVVCSFKEHVQCQEDL